MNLSQAALRRSFTVIAIVITLALASALAWLQMPKDIVPALNLPTIHVTQAYGVSSSRNIMEAEKCPLVTVNSPSRNIDDLRTAPVRGGKHPVVLVRDFAHVQDDAGIASCYALVNGKCALYVPFTKRADASTSAVAREMRANLANFQGRRGSNLRAAAVMARDPRDARTPSTKFRIIRVQSSKQFKECSYVTAN